MNKKSSSVVILILVLVFLFAGCSTKVVSPDNTIKTPELTESKSVKIMSEYRDLMNASSSPSEIMKYIEANIGNLSKEDGDTVVAGLIEVQKKQLQNYQEKLYSREMYVILSKYKFEHLIGLNIIEEDVKKFFENAFKDGYKLITAEGMVDFELDYENLDNKFSPYVTEKTAAFLSIMAIEAKAHFAADGAIIISLDELANRVINTENFLEKFGDSQYAKEIKQQYNWYLTAYLIGLNNTPAFSYEDNIIKQEVLSNFKSTMIKYNDSKLADIIKGYVELVTKNELKKTNEVLAFVTKVTATP
jgi:hypothetical protein